MTAPPAFTRDPSLAEWDVPAHAWLAANQASIPHRLDGLATGSAVFDSRGRVLLVQRASHDSMPDKWEMPGGAVDTDDATVLAAAARELCEEAGLVATHFRALAPAGPARFRVFPNRNASRWFAHVAFHVDVASCQHVRLDPAEHQDFVWATEHQVRQQRVDGRHMPMTHDAVQRLILDAFATRRAWCASAS